MIYSTFALGNNFGMRYIYSFINAHMKKDVTHRLNALLKILQQQPSVSVIYACQQLGCSTTGA